MGLPPIFPPLSTPSFLPKATWAVPPPRRGWKRGTPSLVRRWFCPYTLGYCPYRGKGQGGHLGMSRAFVRLGRVYRCRFEFTASNDNGGWWLTSMGGRRGWRGAHSPLILRVLAVNWGVPNFPNALSGRNYPPRAWLRTPMTNPTTNHDCRLPLQRRRRH